MLRNFQAEALHSQAKFIIVQAARRTGKTELAIRWAVQEAMLNQKRVLFLSVGEANCARAAKRVADEYRKYLYREYKDYLAFQGGGKILFRTHRDDFTGDRFDRIIVDDASHNRVNPTNIFHLMAGVADTRLLVVGGQGQKGSLMKHFETFPARNAYYIEHNYLDALKENTYKAEFITDLQGSISPEWFKMEYGPWNLMGVNKKDVTNKDVMSLLKPIEMYGGKR